MRILYSVHAYKPAYRVGGPIMSVSAKAEHLVRKGHRVTVFTTNSNQDEDLDVPLNQPVDVEGVEVWYFQRRDDWQQRLPLMSYVSKSIGFLYTPEMAAALDRIVPTVDLVHTHMPFVYPTYAAAKAARRFDKPLFYHQRGVFDPERLKFRSLKKRLYINLIERPIMQQAAALVALTEAELASFRALGVQTPCHVIPNGIDPTQYRQQPSAEIVKRWPIDPEAQVILFLGRLHPLKGADKLLEAFGRIQSQFPRALLVLAGPDEWGLEARFRQTVQQAGLAGRVVFTGMVSGEAKLDLLARADLFCLPSAAEGFSMAVLEALASRTAVLLSPGCHFPVVEQAGAGRIADTEPESLACALSDLLAQPQRLRAMGQAGLELVKQRYSWNTITDQLLDAYRQGIERHAAFRLRKAG